MTVLGIFQSLELLFELSDVILDCSLSLSATVPYHQQHRTVDCSCAEATGAASDSLAFQHTCKHHLLESGLDAEKWP